MKDHPFSGIFSPEKDIAISVGVTVPSPWRAVSDEKRSSNEVETESSRPFVIWKKIDPSAERTSREPFSDRKVPLNSGAAWRGPAENRESRNVPSAFRDRLDHFIEPFKVPPRDASA